MALILPIRILIIALISLPVMAGAAPLADVLAQPAPEIAGAEIKLADLAKVQSNNADFAKKLESVPICPSPLPGKTRAISRDQIIIAMRRQSIADNTVNLVCPAQIIVKRSASLVTGKAIFDAAEEYILKNTPWPGTVTVEPVRLPADISVPVGSIELRARNNFRKPPKGRTSLPVEVLVDGQVYTTVHISVVVRVFARVMVAVKPINRTEIISTDNVAFEDREITNLPEDLMTDLPSTEIMANVPISQGAIVKKGWISEPPAIKSGDSVTVVVSGNTVRVSEKGIAAGDGRKGDRIKVRLLGDIREVRGTVVEPGLVEIPLSRRN